MRRLLRPAVLGAASLVLAGTLTLLAAVGLGGVDRSAPSTSAAVSVTGRAGVGGAGGPASIPALQARLSRLPDDDRAWSALALAYVERARVTADPAFYSRAAAAVHRAIELAPRDTMTQTARASLAVARHRFAAGRHAADRAIAADRHNASAWLLRSDGLSELGRYRAARRAAVRADELDPGPATFARLSYQAELRGDVPEATRLMRLARDASTTDAASYAFAAFHLGELARVSGDPRAARRHYAAALDAAPGYAPATAGRARLAVARGDVAAAVRDYRDVVSRLPLPEYVAELADLYLATGRPRLAEQQLTVAAAAARLAEANGVRTDLETALVEADHGSPAVALRAARAEWAVRQTVHTADAMAWALHAAGRDADALAYARRATALGTRDARLLFHRGVIEAALGRTSSARSHLRAAVRLDAGVAPLREKQARELLERLR